MEQMVTDKEIEEIINNLKVGKTPGTYGLGPEYYKVFKKILIPKLKELFNKILKGEEIPLSWRESLIVLILKPDKNPANMDAYRPISLINQDAKIFTAIMAKRLNSFMWKYIEKDQNGFILGRQMSDLMRRVLNVMNLAKESNSKAGVISLDIFKAFDSVEWESLKTLIKYLGFGSNFNHIIHQLYSQNTAKVIVNDGITETIYLGRGTRQGCPLSPVLFTMIIEILAQIIREDKQIRGVDNKENGKINLFADDTLLIVNNPAETIERLKIHLKEFESLTGLRVNWGKSECLLLNHSEKEKRKVEIIFEGKIGKVMKYLGINITWNLQEIIEINLDRLKTDIIGRNLERY